MEAFSYPVSFAVGLLLKLAAFGKSLILIGRSVVVVTLILMTIFRTTIASAIVTDTLWVYNYSFFPYCRYFCKDY